MLFVEPADIEIGHDDGRQYIDGRGRVDAQARGRCETDSTVSCGVPGHDRAGYEVVMNLLDVNGDPFEYRYEGRCGFVASFDYRSNRISA